MVTTNPRVASFRDSSSSSFLLRFLDHYRRDLGSSLMEKLESQISAQVSLHGLRSLVLTTLKSPPCVLTWLHAQFENGNSHSAYDTDFPAINAACTNTRVLFRVGRILFGGSRHVNGDLELVSFLSKEGFQTANQVHDELPAGVALPLLEALNRCGREPSEQAVSAWTASELALVGRGDLSMNSISIFHAPTDVASSAVGFKVTGIARSSLVDREKDGLVPIQVSSASLFPADNRIKEAGRLVRSSTPCYLSVPRAIEVSDHDYEQMKQKKLLLLCRRALALSVGRGMLTIGSFRPVAAEPVPVPDLCMAGRVPPTDAILSLDMTECHACFKMWPEFHNGVAAGLRLPFHKDHDAEDSTSKITRTWIVYNRPNQSNDAPNRNQTSPRLNVHGGLLLALGLHGHLAALEMADLFDYLTQGHTTLTCGVLLGMAANKRGSCDIAISKMLCLHLPSLIPQHFSAIDVASPVQIAAVTGAGLLFEGSSHRMMTEFLLNEISRRPERDVALDREAYVLSCGIALGMVNLSQGGLLSGAYASVGEGLDDLQVGERLYRYIMGGTDENEVRRRREDSDRVTPTSANFGGENERCSCVFEGDMINIDVTAAGATLALGLIFFRSGNPSVANMIALPDSHFLLEYVRPDFLALRVISRALILWDRVQPSRGWIEQQLPQIVADAHRQMKSKIKTAAILGGIQEFAGASDLFLENDVSKEVVHVRSTTASVTPQPQAYDCQAVRQNYVYVIAGACLGLGLRFAGTAEKQAAGAVFESVIELQTLRDANDSVTVAMRPDCQTLETCLGSCAISLAMILAGTGDLEVLKLFKVLRWRCDDQVKYGTHMSYGIAIGLLFLGGGTCTLGRSPNDIAALLAAFFPRFPVTTTDNQYHLQALRHLYVLAVKRSDVRVVDIDTGDIVRALVEIKYRDNSRVPLRLATPCLLPDVDEDAVEAQIVADGYFPLKLELSHGGMVSFGRTFYVKCRRTSQNFNNSNPTSHSCCKKSLRLPWEGVRSDVRVCRCQGVLGMAKYLCGEPWTRSHEASVDDFCKSLLRDCLTGVVTDLTLPAYLRLRVAVASIESKSSSSSLWLWDFRLILGYSKLLTQSQRKLELMSMKKMRFLTEFVEQVAENCNSLSI